MIIKERELYLFGVFSIMFFWDQLNGVKNHLPLLLLGLILFIYIVLNRNMYMYKNAFILFAFLIFQGGINITFGNDTLGLFLSQFLSILLCVAAYTTLIHDTSISEIIRMYWKFSVAMSLVALVQEATGILNINAGENIPVIGVLTKHWGDVSFFTKVTGFCQEPSFLGYFLSPAAGLVVLLFICKERVPSKLHMSMWQCYMIIIAFICTFSLTAYVGLVFMIIFAWSLKGISLKKLLIPLLAMGLAVTMYIYIPDINVRVNDTVNVFSGGTSSEDVNLSSYTYYSNYSVMRDGLKSTFLSGSGLGSYPLTFDKFNPGGWGTAEMNPNRDDGNSMLFRILTELGMLGFIAVIYFMTRYFVNKRSEFTIYSRMIIPLFLMLLIRQGNYTHGGVILFACIYYKAYLDYRAEREN